MTSREPSVFGRRPAIVDDIRRLSVLSVLVLLSACLPSTSTSPAATSPAASPVGADDALAAVIAQDPMFAAVEPRDPELIGQAAWSEVTETDDGWQVVIRIGWGDCPSGCISEHRWTYAVSPGGDVSLVDESGAPLPTDTGVRGTVVAGPTCPVVTEPPDPACADRPVADAELVVTTRAGDEVARATSDADGTFAIALAPGLYRLEPQPVDGLMGTDAPMEFTVEWGMLIPELVVSYDTGIR